MTESTLWWLLAGGAVALELATGTFYLLMMAAGLVAAALSAHAGASLAMQVLVAAVVGGGAVIGWHWFRQKGIQPRPATANRDVNLDIGSEVTVTEWNADGTSSVKFRGAQWSAVAAHADETATVGLFNIVEVHGNRLTLARPHTAARAH